MIKRITKATAGLLVMPFCMRIFNPRKIFKGKRVAIIGAASSALEKANGDYIDSFDYVIRINKAIVCWQRENDEFLGTKCNILFHSFYENSDEGGGGPLDINIFNKRNIDYLVQPRNNMEGWRVVYNFFKKYLKYVKVYILPRSFYKILHKQFGTLKPTMGFCALYSVLNSACSEVFITGFTFFKTPYALGYRDNLLDMKANENHIKKQGQHDPDLEYNLFKELIERSGINRIMVDQGLYEIMRDDSSVPASLLLKH